MTALKGAFAVGWLGLPIFCAMVLEVVERNYILQENGRSALWIAAAAGVWLLLSLLIPGSVARLLHSPKAILMLVFWAAMTGWSAGLLAIHLVNCAADSSEARPATIAKIDRTVRMVTVVTIADPSPGVVFSCPRAAWLEGEVAGKRFFVHTGRLGLLWGELR
jgi:hypothetical protein